MILIKWLLEKISFISGYLAPVYIIFDDYFAKGFDGWVYKWFAILLIGWIIWKYGKRIYKWMTEMGQVKDRKKEMLVNKPRRPFFYIIARQGVFGLVFFLLWSIAVYTRDNSNLMIDTLFNCMCAVGVGVVSYWLSLLIKREEVKI